MKKVFIIISLIVVVIILLSVLVMFYYKPIKKIEEGINLSGLKIVMIIAEKDFRDEELQKPKEILEKYGAKVVIASSTTNIATGMLGMKIKPDILLNEINIEEYNAIIFVGGSGASQYWNDPIAHSIAKEAIKKDKILCAICIAPVTLANAGILQGKKATVWPSEAEKIKNMGAIYTGASVEIDEKIITANGPAAAEEFGEAIAKALASKK
ncbi:MAG: DJ-1/PfpI family protein [Nitrososphaerota archaeon]